MSYVLELNLPSSKTKWHHKLTLRRYGFFSVFCLSAEVVYIKDLGTKARSTPEYPAVTSYETDLDLKKLRLHLITDIEGSCKIFWERNENLNQAPIGRLRHAVLVCDLVYFKYTEWSLWAEKLTSLK